MSYQQYELVVQFVVRCAEFAPGLSSFCFDDEFKYVCKAVVVLNVSRCFLISLHKNYPIKIVLARTVLSIFHFKNHIAPIRPLDCLISEFNQLS